MAEEDHKKFISLLVSRAQNQQPLLSRMTTFNRIDVPASSDPLNGSVIYKLCLDSVSGPVILMFYSVFVLLIKIGTLHSLKY